MSNFKKNIWMYGIIGACVAFASVMTGFGIMASHHHIDLVVSDYYKEEINYQKRINKINNYAQMTHKPEISIDSIQDNLKVRFPAYNIADPLSGRICLYRPNDQKSDDTLALVPNDAGIADIAMAKYPKGRWKMRMEWQQGTLSYYVEQSFKLK